MAQSTTGTVTGVVTDPAGALVSGASITLLNSKTGATVSARTDSDGRFVFPLTPPGSYRLSAEMTGFQKFATDFDLMVDQVARIDVRFAVGQMSESITVSEKAVMLQSESSSLGQVIENRQVLDLPMNGRNPFGLAALTPGVTPLGSFGVGLNATRAAAQMAGANNFMANGGVAGYNEILLDGVAIVVCCQGQPALIPSIDVTQEFKVQTNSSAAEYGRTSGGIINVVTKSGTNSLHGSAYEFLRNEKLDAAGFFLNRSGRPPIPGRSDMRPPLRFNQFGFTVGGPVVLPKLYDGRNKTFFFGGYEGIYVRKLGFNTTTVPTALMHSGDFSEAPGEIYDPLTTMPDPARPGQYIRSPFPGKLVPSARLNPISSNYAKLWPQALRPGVVNNFDWFNRPADTDKQVNARVDHAFTENYRLFGRFSFNDNSNIAPGFTPANDWNQFVKAKTFVLDQVKVLSPTMLLNVRYGFAHQRNVVSNGGTRVDPLGFGFAPSYVSQMPSVGLPQIALGGFATLSDPTSRNWSRYSHSLAVSMTWVKTRHTIKAGWDGRLFLDNQLTLDGGAGTFSYGSGFTTGPDPRAGVPSGMAPYLNYASFYLGIPASGSNRYNDSRATRQPYNAFYIQDDWRLSTKLTINAGLRYDIDSGFSERYNRLAVFDPDMTSPLAQQVNMPLKGGAVFLGANGGPSRQWATNRKFGPRIGLAYSLTPKTVIRTGYAIFFMPTAQRGYGTNNPGFMLDTPFVATIDGVTPVGTISNPFPSGLLKPAGSTLGAMTSVGAGIGGIYYDSPLSYAQQWNFGVQRELPGNVLLNVAYAGNRGVKLPLGFGPNDLNPMLWGAPGDSARVAELTQLVSNPFYGVIKTGALAGQQVQRQVLLRPYPQFTSVSMDQRSWASSTYHALQVTIEKRLSYGFSTLLSYTFSKNIGDANNLITGFLDVGTPGFQNQYNRRLERTVLATDIPQRLVLSGVWELPFGKGKRFATGASGIWNQLAGGWQMNGIVTLQSGFPLNITASGAPAFAGNRPSFASGVDPLTSGDIHNRLGGVSSSTGYLNPAAFRFARSFEFGDVPRLSATLRMPQRQNVDFSILKNFPIRESLRMQFRAEAFNLLNQVNFSGPATTFGSPTFGVIGGQANSPRNLQVALKLIW